MATPFGSKLDHDEPHEAISVAARWLTTSGADKSHSIVPQLRELLSLTAAQAIEAIRASRAIGGRGQ